MITSASPWVAGTPCAGQSDKAIITLEPLALRPYRPEYPQFSTWAKAFYNTYNPLGDGETLDLFGACYAANTRFESQRNLYALTGPNELGYDTAKMAMDWGYVDPSWGADLNGATAPDGSAPGACSLPAAFRAALAQANLPHPMGLVNLLSAQRVPYLGLTFGDIDGDWKAPPTPLYDRPKPWEPTPTPTPLVYDEDDWLLLAGTGPQGSMQMWAVIRDVTNHLHGAIIANLPGSSSQTRTLWRAFRPAYEQGLVNAYQVDDQMFLFRVFLKDGQVGFDVPVDRNGAFSPWTGVNSMQLFPGVLTDRLIVSEFDGDLQNLGWNEDNMQISFNGPSLASQIGQIEDLLFNQLDASPGSAITDLKTMLDKRFHDEIMHNFAYGQRPLPRTRPYLLYLLGVANELNGNKTAAVEVYWRLATDYPTSPYGWLAQQKIQPLD